MKGKRRRHDPEFKARVVLEAIKGIRTIQEIAKEYEIHPVQVSDWKKAMLERAASVFGPGAKDSAGGDFEGERERLHAKIEQQAVEIDFAGAEMMIAKRLTSSPLAGGAPPSSGVQLFSMPANKADADCVSRSDHSSRMGDGIASARRAQGIRKATGHLANVRKMMQSCQKQMRRFT